MRNLIDYVKFKLVVDRFLPLKNFSKRYLKKETLKIKNIY
jgi:hypothetical protein